jgi:hypothetical protein
MIGKVIDLLSSDSEDDRKTASIACRKHQQ